MCNKDKFDSLFDEMVRAEWAYIFNPNDETKAAYEKAYREAAVCHIREQMEMLQELKKKRKARREELKAEREKKQ